VLSGKAILPPFVLVHDTLQRSRIRREQLNVLTTRFRKALKKSVEGIIESGRVLIEAKDELEHGQFYRLGSS
jgi:hypothetical protein